MFLYIVDHGDNLDKIAKNYHSSVETIVKDNALSDPNTLVIGQALIIRSKNFDYTVKSGDSLYTIARRFATNVDQILLTNKNLSLNTPLQVGQIIKIDYYNYNKRKIEVNGYAYPTISNEVLLKTLPNLTYITVFSYDVKEDGSLKDVNDSNILMQAQKYQVAPILSVSNTNEKGSFDSELAHKILSDKKISELIIDNAVKIAIQKNYYGINFDFEYVYPKDRENYNQFLKDAKVKCEQKKLILLTALAPKVKSDQKGLLYEAHDYETQGTIVDRIILMTYEWGYTFGPAMAVAPFNKVDEVLTYATKAIPSNKILMGIPNYGYDFKVPYKEKVAARSLPNLKAIKLASEVKAEILFNKEAKSPYFTYRKDNQLHEVHFEDARSIVAKLLLVISHNLAGISFWTLKDYYNPSWVILNHNFEVIKYR